MARKSIQLCITLAAILMLVVTGSARRTNSICHGWVRDGGSPVSGASLKCYYSDGQGGFCGEIATSPVTTDSLGYFNIIAGSDSAGYYNVCVTKNTKWQHRIAFFSNATTGTNLDTLNLSSASHPTHPPCRE